MALVFNTHPLFDAHGLFSPRIPHHRYATRYLEEDKRYTITLELPGVASDQIKVRLTDAGQLTICVVDSSGDVVLERQFRLEADADPTTVASWCKDGILEVTVAKIAPPDPVVVDIQPALPPSDAGDERIYELRYKVPGVSAAEITAQVESSILHISTNSQRSLMDSNWQIGLPDDAKQASIRAYCLHGLLVIQIPRSEPAPPVTIPIASNADELPEDFKVVSQLRVPGRGSNDLLLKATAGTLHLQLGTDGQIWERQLHLPHELKVANLHDLRAVCANGLLLIGYSPQIAPAPQSIELKVSTNKPQPQPTDESESNDWVDARMPGSHE